LSGGSGVTSRSLVQSSYIPGHGWAGQDLYLAGRDGAAERSMIARKLIGIRMGGLVDGPGELGPVP
jgi:hypothetical protein